MKKNGGSFGNNDLINLVKRSDFLILKYINMKEVTLVAIIAIILDTLASLYFSLQRFEVFRFNETIISDIFSTFFLLSNIGLLIFFIRLYQKQLK